jgi:mRNA interferase RelE/StbE
VSDPAWEVVISSQGQKDLRRLDQPIRQRVFTALQGLAADPAGGQLRKLSGRAESRLRVGDWRILLTLDREARAIRVDRVLPRGRAYDR